MYREGTVGPPRPPGWELSPCRATSAYAALLGPGTQPGLFRSPLWRI